MIKVKQNYTKQLLYIDTLMFVEKRRKAIFEKGGDRLVDEEVVSMFNKLLKENEQLKSEIKDLNDDLARYKEKELKK